MSTTSKNRDFRLQIIHKCLKNEKVKWSKKRLHERVQKSLDDDFREEISSRSILGDLEYLKVHKGAPIDPYKEGKFTYYRYSEPFELNENVVDADQAFSLALAKDVLRHLKGFPLIEELEAVVENLEQRIALEGDDTKGCIIFDEQPLLRNIHWLQRLFEYIREKKVIKVQYKPFLVKETLEKIIHPYTLKQYNGRWYLFGYDASNKRIDCSPIDRIEEILPLRDEFVRVDFNPEEYFKPIVGVTRYTDKVIEKITLEVSKERAEYLTTKQLHHSQKEIRKTKADTTIIELELIPNKELVSQLLSFGKDIVVLQPESLRNERKTLLENALSNYTK